MKKIFTFLILVLLSTNLFAYDFEVDGIYYNITDKTHKSVEVTAGQNAYAGIVNIPDSVIYNDETYAVTAIGNSAFYYCTDILSVNLPNTIESINGGAFSYAGTYQYSSDGEPLFPSITIPRSVTYIGSGAFSGSYFHSVFYEGDETSWCSIEFADAEANPLFANFRFYIDSIQVTEFVIPEEITEIPKYAFTGMSFFNVVLHDKITSIGEGAFYYRDLGDFTIPASVTYIDMFAFHNARFNSITIEERTNYNMLTINFDAFYTDQSLYDSRVNYEGTLDTWLNNMIFYSAYSNPTSVCGTLYINGELLTELTISKESYGIHDYAFYNCYSLQTINFPDTLMRDFWIGQYAFYGCGLTELDIPDNISQYTSGTNISTGAFKNNSLTEVTLGNNVVSIGDCAFSNCPINMLTLKSFTPPTLMLNAFGTSSDYGGRYDDCSLSSDGFPSYLTIPCGATSTYQDAGWLDYNPIIIEDEENYYNLKIEEVDEQYGTINITQEPTCENGATAILEAVPEKEYRFVEWSDGETANPRSLVVSENMVISARFEIDNYWLSVSSNNSTWGTVSGAGTYLNGTTATITATPAVGYKFVKWNDGNTDNPRTITVTEDVRYTAFFEIDDYTLLVVSDNIGWGTVTGSGDYTKDTEATITAIPADGYRFTHWNDGNTENPRIVQVTQDTTFTAYFATVFTDIQLKQTQLTLEVGDSYYLNTIIEPKDADKSKLIWSSSNEDIVSVDGCIATAHQIGTATITVSTEDNALSATCEIVVVEEGQNASDDVVVDPNDKSVNITWTPVEGAAYYVFVVYADENQVTKICTLTFNAWGFLTNINFLPKKPTLTPENNPFNFTVTGLQENTTYGYSMSSYNEEETLITSKAGQFTTTSNVVTGMETLYDNVSTEVCKVLENGIIYILRNGEKYTIDGRKVSSM